ncbi:MAG: hypothetical protein R2991_03325 [Thermoanaerobaculia bacterium]
MTESARCAALVVLLMLLGAVRPTHAEIQRAIDEAQSAQCDPEVEARLEATIARGRAAIDTLRGENAALQAERDELEQSKQELERVRTALTSGLIGAILTALVAIAGVVVKSLGSRLDRDYRRLEVVEKLAQLEKSGAHPPEDLFDRYLPRSRRPERDGSPGG